MGRRSWSRHVQRSDDGTIFRLGLVDLANPVLVPRLAYWATQETVQVVEPVFVVGRDVVEEEACLVGR